MQVMAEKKPSDQKLAIAAGINYRTLLGYRHRGCTARTVEEIHAWREENVGYGRPTIGERMNGSDKKRDRDDDGLDEEKLRQQIRKLDAEAREKELDVAEREGKLLNADDVELNVGELISMIRARIESIPNELETEWPPEVRAFVTERLSEKLKLILTSMSQWRME